MSEMTPAAQTEDNEQSQPPLNGVGPLLLTEEVSALLAYIDVQHRYRHVNRAYEVFFGSTRAGILGKSIAEVTGAAHYQLAEPYIERVLSGERVSFAASLRRANGKLHEVGVWYTPHLSSDGKVLGFVSLIQEDVPERNFESDTRARLAAIVNSSDDVIISKTLEGVITSWNRSAEKIFGYTAAEAIGQHITLIIPPERRAEEEQVLARLRRGEEIDHFETERRSKDGRTVFVSLSMSPIRGLHGEIIGASKVARDITQRKRDEEALRVSDEYRRTVLESMPECIKVLDRNGNILNMNAAGLRMVEADCPEQVLGSCVYPLIQEQDREAFRLANESVFNGGSGGRLEFGIRGLKGTERIFETDVVPLRGAAGEVIGALSVTRDITSRKEAEFHDAFLVRLDDTIRPLSDPTELMRTVTRLLAEHLGADRCSYAEIDTDLGSCNVMGNYSRNLPSIVGEYPLAVFGESFLRTMQFGKPYVIEDSRTADVSAAYRTMGISAAISAPLVKTGRLVAGLGVHSAVPRKWRSHEIDLVQLVASRCWESIERARIQRTFRESEQQFRTLADAIPNLAWMAHPDGRIFWYNRRWYDYTGTSPEEMEGWGWEKVHDATVLPSVLERWTGSIRSGDGFEMVFPLRGGDGHFRSFLTQVEPVKDAQGRVTRWFGTNTDITTQLEAEAREKKARETAEVLNRIGPLLTAELEPRKLTQKITDIATEAIRAQFGAFFHTLVDEAGESYVLYTLSGVPREAFAGFPMPRNTHVFGPTFRGEGVVRSEDITKDPRYGKNQPYHGIPKGHLPVRSYLAVPVKSRSGSVVGGLFFGHSDAGVFGEEAETIAAGIAAQAAIALDNASLFDETRRSSEALRQSNENLERLNGDLNQFAFSASHDLREPMRMVSIYTQFLARKLKGQLDEEAQAFLGYVLKGAGRMEALLRDLLAYTQAAETVESLVVLTDANEALNEALSNLATGIEESGARMIYSSLPRVKAAQVHLTQVLQNLIGNAIKYRSEDTPEITIGAASRGREVEFFVGDNGIGIEEHYQEQIFGIFKRLHTSEQYPGTGIGLAICQRIVERAGGRIWVKSQPGRGSTFFFTLPGGD